jgi:hypothetical protein
MPVRPWPCNFTVTMNYMKLYRFLLLLLLCNASIATSQTVCEQMELQVKQFTIKGAERLGDKTKASKEDEQYLEAAYVAAIQNINQLGRHQTDNGLLNEYHFCVLSLTGGMANLYNMAGEPAQKLYDLLEPIKNIVLELDNTIMSHYNYITCKYSDGRQAEYARKDYQSTSLNYWTYLMNTCLRLHKTDEAAALFANFKTLDFWVDYNRNYGMAGMLVQYQYQAGLYDTTLFNAAGYALTTFLTKNGYDTTWLTVSNLIAVLNLPQLADSNIPSRADQYFELYKKMNYYHETETGDTICSTAVQQQVLLQAMHAFAGHEMFASFLNLMEYNNDPAINDLVVINDPRLLQNIIALGERFVGKQKLREPYFWQSMAKLYRAAGMNDKAADADRKFRKYKY